MAMPWILCLKSQIPSTKLQINLKFQYSMTKTFQDEILFGISNFGHWKLFDICDLIFVIFELPTKPGPLDQDSLHYTRLHTSGVSGTFIMQDFFYDVTRSLIFVNIPINCTYKKTAAHNVSQSHRNEIYNEKLCPGHVGPVKNS